MNWILQYHIYPWSWRTRCEYLHLQIHQLEVVAYLCIYPQSYMLLSLFWLNMFWHHLSPWHYSYHRKQRYCIWTYAGIISYNFYCHIFHLICRSTESFKTFKQEAMNAITCEQFGIAKFCPKQEIIHVIKKSKEANELWTKCCVTQHGMNIALWKGIVDHFKIEINNFSIDTSLKFAFNNTDIKIQEGVLFVTACTTFK